MSYNKIIYILVLLSGILAFSSCTKGNTSAGSPSLPIDLSSTSKVKIVEDNYERKAFIEDAAQLKKIVNKMNALDFSKGHKYDNSKNEYLYVITWYDNQNVEKGSITILSDDSVDADGYSYANDCKELIDYINSIAIWEPLPIP